MRMAPLLRRCQPVAVRADSLSGPYTRGGRGSGPSRYPSERRWRAILEQVVEVTGSHVRHVGRSHAAKQQCLRACGMRTSQQLDEAIGAKRLTAEQLAEVETVAPRGAIAGTRYPAAHMASLDSEKRSS